MSGSNCCFLTSILISQEAGKVVWYSHLFKNFSVCCDPHKGFSVVNEARIDVFLEFSYCDSVDVGNLISGSSAFSKSSLNIWKFSIHILLKTRQKPKKKKKITLQMKAMATHSSTLAWKIPWTEEPGRLQFMGSRRVRHD